MSNSNTKTEELLSGELFLRSYLSAIEETPDDISRLLSEFRELKSESGKTLRDIDAVIGFGSGKLSTESLKKVENLLAQHSRLQEEMLACASKLRVLINGVTSKLNELAAVSNPNAAVNDDDVKEVDPPEPMPDVVQVPKKKRGRKPKSLTVDSSPVVEGLDLLANAVSMVSLNVKTEPVVRTKKVPITKFKKKLRKRSKTSDARVSKDEEPSEDEDLDDSTDKPDEDLFCVCNRRSAGEMIACDNELCSIEWFHFDCVKVKKAPPSKWYCPKCRGRKSNVMKKELEAAGVKYQKYQRQTRNSMF